MKPELYKNHSGVSRRPVDLFAARISAGFPSPAEDYIDKKLDLNEYLIRNPAATFFVRVHGDSMRDAAIRDGDMLVVDRSEQAVDGNIVVAALNGELVVKRVNISGGKIYLVAENTEYEPIEVGEEEDLVVWGVVTAVVHKL